MMDIAVRPLRDRIGNDWRKAEKERAEKEKAALDAATDTDKSKKGA